MIALPWIVLALALLTFARFAWAIKRFFVTEGPPQPGMGCIKIGGVATVVVHLATLGWLAPAGGAWGIAGGLLYLAALGLFQSAIRATSIEPPTLAFTPDEPTQLVTDGPYRLVRHPFYAAYLLAWIAGTVATAQPALLVTATGMGALYVLAARYEEMKFAHSPLAADYAAYQRRAGLFLPRLRRSSGVVESRHVTS